MKRGSSKANRRFQVNKTKQRHRLRLDDSVDFNVLTRFRFLVFRLIVFMSDKIAIKFISIV